jgi:hypothetical protein
MNIWTDILRTDTETSFDKIQPTELCVLVAVASCSLVQTLLCINSLSFSDARLNLIIQQTKERLVVEANLPTVSKAAIKWMIRSLL